MIFGGRHRTTNDHLTTDAAGIGVNGQSRC